MLKESEIPEKSIIVIEYEEGEVKPYYVNTKGVCEITKGSMLLGYPIVELVEKVKDYGLDNVWPIANKGLTDCYYIENETIKIGDRRVKNYRFPTESEKPEIKKMLLSVGLNELAATLIEDNSKPLSFKEIEEKKIIVITKNDNQRIPFYVAFTLTAVDLGKTIIMGLPVEDIIKNKTWPIESPDFLENYFFNKNLYSDDPEIKKCSRLTGIEKMKLQNTLLNNKLSEVAACID